MGCQNEAFGRKRNVFKPHVWLYVVKAIEEEESVTCITPANSVF